MDEIGIDEDLKPLAGRGGPVNQSETMNRRLSLATQALRNLERTFQMEGFMTRSSIEDLGEGIKTLQQTIKDLDTKNSNLQKVFLALTIIATIFTVAQVVQVIDILFRGIGR